jgi:hypothetical protein
MATTSNTYTGNGSNKLFSITFPYLETTDVDVYLNGTLQTITTQYTFANATTIEFVAAPGNGAVVLLDRSTDDATLQATFFPGSSIKAADLNLDFDQVLYIAQETTNEAQAATASSNAATTTANTALSNSTAAVSTANTASSNASAAVSTANTASTNASNAVTTANTASSNASTAITTANAAVVTANTASSNASAAVSTANTASSNASAAVSTANTASTNASAAVTTANAANSTANTASTNASNAVTTANAATATANTANTNASAAVATANSAQADATNAIAAVSAASLYVIVANVAAIPGSPTNNQGVQVSNTTGLESFTPLSGIPVGFVGSAALYARIRYSTGSSSWVWVDYAANDPEGRYLAKTGGTMTGALVLSGAPTVGLNPTTKTYVDAADGTLTTAAAAAQSTANTANTTANAALPKAGGTMTGAIENLTVNTGDASIYGVRVGRGLGAISTNTALGNNALNTNTTGSNNTGVGQSALYSTTTGYSNTAVGVSALYANTTGYSNVAYGVNALSVNTIGVQNTANGFASLYLNVSGDNNTAHGFQALYSNTTGGTNTCYGYNAGNALTTGSNNTIIGSIAGTAGLSNTVIIGAGATERLRIDSSGRFGLGTSSPAVTLDVSGTDAIRVAAGTTGQRPTGAAGMIRYNSTLGQFEGYGAAWGTIGGGAKGGGSDDIFYENGQTVTTNYTLTTSKNAMTAGPVAINSGVTVTVPSGSSWTIV